MRVPVTKLRLPGLVTGTFYLLSHLVISHSVLLSWLSNILYETINCKDIAWNLSPWMLPLRDIRH